MECAETQWPDHVSYLKRFNAKVFDERVPLSGSLDLTHRCNLRCIHCFLGPESIGPEKEELTTGRLLSIIDEMAEAGCLNLLLTGGEPLLKENFVEVYRHAKTKGLLVSAFTNGTLMTERLLDLFADLPPQYVEISLYGATAGTYERITGVRGSYERCLKGIRALLERGIPVRLKTVLMTLNEHELPDMENLSKGLGVKFRFDAALFPRLNGDRSPLALRVPPEEAVKREFSDSRRSEQYADYFHRTRGLMTSDFLYVCGAGLTSFHISPYGRLQPCLMAAVPGYDLSRGSFLNGWHDVIAGIREKKADAFSVCNRCDKRALCGYCPPFFKLENGSEEICSEYLCAMGDQRFRAIVKLTSEVTDGN